MDEIIDQMIDGECIIKIYSNGHIEWTKDGKFHREDGPALETSHSKCWYREGKLHRLDGPAVENADGDKFWFRDGKSHRTDGPAVESSDGEETWFYEGEQIDCKNQEEFERLIKIKAFW